MPSTMILDVPAPFWRGASFQLNLKDECMMYRGKDTPTDRGYHAFHRTKPKNHKRK